MTDAATQVDMYSGLLAKCGAPLVPGCAVLDLGCGAGRMTCELRRRGFAASGVDIAPAFIEEEARARAEGLIGTEPVFHLLDLARYRLPFPDASFDCIISNQVLEHAMNLPQVLAEISRVLRPGGASLNLFPPRWRPIEAHVFVPLAGLARGKAWLGLWAWLGIRNSFQWGLGWREVARLNHAYLHAHTIYPGKGALRAAARSHFSAVSFEQSRYLECAFGRLRHLRGIPFAGWLTGTFVCRVLLLRR